MVRSQTEKAILRRCSEPGHRALVAIHARLAGLAPECVRNARDVVNDLLQPLLLDQTRTVNIFHGFFYGRR
jgi:hypothetical protein